ncbi:RNA polymerase sigma factor [Emcibacter sp.]|uniref:RNA polymerase sigma factor n=1 Tax=Emcibacter sp. TaxID=1979954 RepID=UPI002AA96111|nr:sigma-70 family RNA polymerase sigma factor [Emcibacter sp.]
MDTTPEQWRDGIVALLPRLRRFSFALTASAADADDLLQATVEKALSRYEQFEPGTDLDKWLFRMCKNLWIDEWRSRRVRGPSVDPMDFRSEIQVDGEKLLQDKVSMLEVREAMDKLRDDQKVVLALVAIEGYSYKEVSNFLDVPIGTVMSRLARARSALQDILSKPQVKKEKGADNAY